MLPPEVAYNVPGRGWAGLVSLESKLSLGVVGQSQSINLVRQEAASDLKFRSLGLASAG